MKRKGQLLMRSIFKWRRNIFLKKVSVSKFTMTTVDSWKIMSKWSSICRPRREKFFSWGINWTQVRKIYWECMKISKDIRNKLNFSTIFWLLLWNRPDQWFSGVNSLRKVTNNCQPLLKQWEKTSWISEQTLMWSSKNPKAIKVITFANQRLKSLKIVHFSN